MLEQLDLDISVPRDRYLARLPECQDRLYDLEHAMHRANVPVIVVFEGWAAAGKGGAINVLTERLDARGFRVVAITPPRTLETRFPWLWRFWLKIPPGGQMVIFDNSWYRRVLIDRITGSVRRREWESAYQDIRDFEDQLAAGGTLIVKFWLHIDRKEQARRFARLQKNRWTAWQVSEEDAIQHRKYDAYLNAAEEMLARTDSHLAPWTIVEAHDRYHTRLKVYETLIGALETRLGIPADSPADSKDDAFLEVVHA